MRTYCIHTAQNSTQIMRVFQFVQNHQQRILSLLPCSIYNILPCYIIGRSYRCCYALMVFMGKHFVQFAPLYYLYSNPFFFRQRDNFTNRALLLPFRQPNFIDGTIAFQRFHNRIAPKNISHIKSSFLIDILLVHVLHRVYFVLLSSFKQYFSRICAAFPQVILPSLQLP